MILKKIFLLMLVRNAAVILTQIQLNYCVLRVNVFSFGFIRDPGALPQALVQCYRTGTAMGKLQF